MRDGTIVVHMTATGRDHRASRVFFMVLILSLTFLLLGSISTLASQALASELPDGRVYERVSSPANVEVYVPSRGYDTTEDVNTDRPFRASSDGNTVAYVGDSPSSGEGGNGSTGAGGGNQYLATRGTLSWSAANITPTGSSISGLYEAFSANLSFGVLHAAGKDRPLTPFAPENCSVLYARGSSDGGFESLFTAAQTAGGCTREELKLYGGASLDGSRLFFQSSGVLTEDEAAEAEGEGKENLYESVHGVLRSVNILGGAPDPNATLGGPKEAESETSSYPDLSHAVSADGARVYWTDLNSGILYVRVNGTSTIPVSVGPARFWTASRDGRFAYYTEEEAPEEAKLVRFDLQSETREEVVAGSARVQGLVGMNEDGEDGEYLYFVAEEALAGNSNSNGEEAVSGQPNLYLLHAGTTTFIATLSPQDNEILGADEREEFGDWRASLGDRTASVIPDGRDLVFQSRRSLTGYDNSVSEGPLPEVFLYDVASGRIVCASCNPSGTPPTERLFSPTPLNLLRFGAFLPPSAHATYMLRWIAADGSRVFFDTGQPLVAQDTNGRQDVYEWEREGSGTCPAGRPGGCVFLLSGGASTDESYFVDASSDGNDVFFTTRGPLVPSDRDIKTDLYDARVAGGFPEVSEGCSGTDCPGVPSASVTFSPPATVTSSGAGNFTPPTPIILKSKPKSKLLTRAQKLAKALKACGKQSRKRRSVCEKRARKGYGSKSKAKRSTRTLAKRRGR